MSLNHEYSASSAINNARGGRDPTGLADVRNRFQHETDLRWKKLRQGIRQDIVGRDVLGVGTNAPALAQPTANKARLFQGWLNERLMHHVVGGDGVWLRKHLARAAGRAVARAGRLTGGPPSPAVSLPASLPACHAASVVALADICSAASSAAHDAVHLGLLVNPSAGKLARGVDQALARGQARTRMLAEHAVTQAYTQSTLDTLQALGVTHVGSLSEHRVHDSVVHDSIFPRILGTDPDQYDAIQLEAAGIMFVDPDQQALFLHRADGEGWAFPGGGIEPNETPEIAAVREGQEEVGGVPIGALRHVSTRTRNGVTFHTFRHDTYAQFEPQLNHEHDDWQWAPLKDPPSPLHPGVAWTLRREGLIDFDPGEPRDERGRWTAAGSAGGYEFVSPNVGNIGFGQARQRLSGERQQQMLQVSSDVDRAVGVSGQSVPVIGAWADGAEHSTMTVADHADWDHLKLAAAIKGHLADQKQVLVFKESEAGEPPTAALYSFRAKGDLGEIHQHLLEDGAAFHTLQPTADGAMVFIADPSRSVEMQDVAARAGARYGAEVDVHQGRAEFIGTSQETGSDREQRDDARRIYQALIAASPVPGSAAIWQGLHNRWAKTLAEVSDANPYRHPKSGRFITKQHHATLRSVAGRQRIKRRFARLKALGGEWDVETAEDDRVCPICEEIAASGPYEIDIARDLIPAHPNCRCIFTPAAAMQDALRDYDPDEPRDERGRWSSGGGGQAEGDEPGKESAVPGSMAKAAWILEKAKTAVADVGYDPERVFLSLNPPKFKVGDHEYTTGGVAFTRNDGVDGGGNQRQKGDIVIYGEPDFSQDFPVRSIAVHEAMHQKWQAVYDAWIDEANYRDGYQGPLRARLSPFISGNYSLALEKADGVSEYSKSYWDSYNQGPVGQRGRVSYESAVHETLAEIARIEDEGTAFAHPIAPVWRNFYKAVNESWDKYVKPKSFAHA